MWIQKLKSIHVMSLLTASLLVGCSGSGPDAPPLGQVSGTVSLDGKPLTQANITFQPQTGAPSVGMTDETGKYELAYNKDHQGAVTGKHTVRISKMGEPGSPNDTQDQVPAKFNQTSKLTAEVKTGENTFDFDLDSKAK